MDCPEQPLNVRAEAAAQVFLRVATEAGIPVTPDHRVALAHAAQLVGLASGSMRNLVSSGDGPPTYRLGIRGHRVTVSLIDLAIWRETRRR